MIALSIGIFVGAIMIISNAIRDENYNRNPFWWIFFFGIFGAVIYLLLNIRDTRLSMAKRLCPIEDRAPATETEDERLEFLKNRVLTENPELYKEYKGYCDKKNLEV